jgi:hypothetical protein
VSSWLLDDTRAAGLASTTTGSSVFPDRDSLSLRRKAMTAPAPMTRDEGVGWPMPGGWMGFLLSVLPLGVDTFAIAAVVGTCRPLGWARWRISAVFLLFEGGMPLAGFALGAGLGHTVGSLGGYLSGGLLVLLGGYLCWTDDCSKPITTSMRMKTRTPRPGD